MNLRKLLKNAIRKMVGWAFIVFSVFSFIACLILLGQGAFGPFATGLMFSLFLLVVGWSIQTNLEKPRKHMIALTKRYLPRCPICKATKGYEARGFLPSSQYIKCRNCGAEWTSSDFLSYKDLKSLKLWKLPEDSEISAEFVSKSPLKLRRTYSTKLWQALMSDEEIQMPTKTRRIQLVEFARSHKKIVVFALFSSILILTGLFSFTFSYSFGCFGISFGVSSLIALVGFYGFSVGQGKSYVLFWATFLGTFFGLMGLS